jgi:hypothetical protein
MLESIEPVEGQISLRHEASTTRVEGKVESILAI